jgi:DNA-binding response OmpR family regulator
VDDEPSLTRVVAGYLEHEGFVVTTAPDGQQALAAARRDPPDVVVLDLMMPGIDGIDGFEPAIATRLFEGFYRGDTSRTASNAGSGMG